MAPTLSFSRPVGPLVSVVVVAWRSAPHLADCLDSLLRNESGTPYELVLVLNEPDSALSSFVEREVAGATVVHTRVNVGYGGAVNLGVRRGAGEFVALLNDDAVVEPGWLGPLVDTLRRRPEAAAVGSTTLFPDGTIQEAGSVIWSDGTTVKVGRNLPAGSRRYDYERRVDFCSGTSLCLRRASLEAAGGLDVDRFFPAYYEDTDLCLRLAARGGQVWYQPRSYVRHLESASTNFFYRDFLMTRNRRAFAAQWSELLARRVDPGERTEREVDLGVHLAMGAPVKVLGLTEPAGRGEALSYAAGERCHLALAAGPGAPDDPALARAGVRVVECSGREALAALVATECPAFALVLDLRARAEDSPEELAARLEVVVARPVAGDPGRLVVAGLPAGDREMPFAELVAALDRSGAARAVGGRR